jgi:O-antigen/teichoic acid export membrane protein
VLTKVFRRASAVAIGTGAGQGLVLVATPFLARAYSPAEFGTLALLMTVSNVSMAVACLRYDLALPSTEEDEVRGLLVTTVVVAAVLGVLSFLLSLQLSHSRVAIDRTAGLLDHPALVGACVFLVGLYQATNAWLLRRGSYGGVAALRLSQGGGFCALAAMPAVGLLWAHVASFGVGLWGAWRAMTDPRHGSVTWTDAARRYRKFPLYSLPGAALDVVGYSICIWVITTFYGRETAGEYSQVQRIIGAPLMLMSISLSQILLKHTAELAHDVGQMRQLLLRLLRVMGATAGAALLVLWVAGKPALSLILGARWRVERETVVLLGLTVFIRACVSPLSTALLTLRRFEVALVWQAAYFCSAALLMPWIASRLDFHGYLRFYAAHEVVFYGAYLYLILLAVRNRACVGSSAS